LSRFKIIYADPPWSYNTKSVPPSKEVTNHYSTLPIKELKNIPIQMLTDKDCFLFLWATFPCLPESLELVNAWGFSYKTIAFNWVKKNKKSDGWFWGLGAYTRANSEICILGKKGSPKVLSRKVHQIIDSRVREHSRKPDEVRDKIVELCGDVPRLELFARDRTPGWYVWGNEVKPANKVEKIVAKVLNTNRGS